MSMIFKAISDPTRRRILELLRTAPLSAGDIGKHFDVSQPTMSAHLSVLKGADLIEGEKAGKQVMYHANMSVLEDALRGFAEAVGLDMEAKNKPDERHEEKQENEA